MHRREFLAALGGGAIGMVLPVAARSAESNREQSCRVIGVGGAGCNLVVATRSILGPDSVAQMPRFICVDLDGSNLQRVQAASETRHGLPAIEAVALGEAGASGSLSVARAAALRRHDELVSLVAGADRVILLAGLGGGTGSAVTPIMARLASACGAHTLAAVVLPFGFEGVRRSRKAEAAVRRLRSGADLVTTVSNEAWMGAHGDDATMEVILGGVERHVAGAVGVMVGAPNPRQFV